MELVCQKYDFESKVISEAIYSLSCRRSLAECMHSEDHCNIEPTAEWLGNLREQERRAKWESRSRPQFSNMILATE